VRSPPPKGVRLVTLIALALATMIIALPAAATTPGRNGRISPAFAGSALTGRILFTRAGRAYRDETVFTANADGTGQRRVTAPGSSCCPRWSPDGRHILMSASSPDGKRITTGIIDANGSHERKIPLPGTTLNLGPGAWSPNGARIAFEGWADKVPGVQGIYVGRSSDGGGLVRVTRCTPMQDDRPMGWSADGARVFFFRAVARFHKVSDEPLGSIFVANVSGTHLRQITPTNLPVEVAGNAGGKISRDGKWIVFTSSGVIWKIRADGSALTKLYEDTQGRLAITPTWSPDGQLILFGLDPAGSLAVTHNAPPNGLYAILADGTGLTPVILSNDWKREPDWVAA
jgi:Tol biopolymer transport system component